MRGLAIATALGMAAVLLGLASIAWGWSMPGYIDRDQALAAFETWCLPSGEVDPAAGDRYAALLSARYDWINLGVGIGLTGVVGILLSRGLARYRQPGEPWLRTPRSRFVFLAIGWGVIAWSWAGNIFGLGLDLERRRFPTCADSIGIPAIALSSLALFLAAILTLLGFAITRGFGPLPVGLNEPGTASRPYKMIVNLFSAIAAAIVAGLGALTATTADSVGTPAYLVALYLIASTRSALIASRTASRD